MAVIGEDCIGLKQVGNPVFPVGKAAVLLITGLTLNLVDVPCRIAFWARLERLDNTLGSILALLGKGRGIGMVMGMVIGIVAAEEEGRLVTLVLLVARINAGLLRLPVVVMFGEGEGTRGGGMGI